ncbi:unnamed protein product [Thelazia callipaeda]|uniref:VWFD domain-containing protein n=1 Tax=Thelazia callipaeda TaxID=103827 RepID=A0A0N5D7B9_THECL|nr:unnamed protein product [Thelazia callipaeda]
MWNSEIGINNNIHHNEYLEEFVPDHEMHDTFLSEAEFWKAKNLYVKPLQVDNEMCGTCMQLDVAMRKILADNQLGTVIQVQGAKEHAPVELDGLQRTWEPVVYSVV